MLLYEKLLDIQAPVTPVIYNYLLYSCAHFSQQDAMRDLLVKTAVLDYPVDVQTYVKCQISLYSDLFKSKQDELENMTDNTD